MTKVPNVIMA